MCMDHLSPTFYLKAQKRYGGQYIARLGDRVLASARTLKALLKQMKTKQLLHRSSVSIGYVPSLKVAHVFTSC